MKNQKKENKKIYNKLKSEGLTDEEIAESYIFPRETEETPEEREEFSKILASHRRISEANRSDVEKDVM